jgi:hypothetical protein
VTCPACSQFSDAAARLTKLARFAAVTHAPNVSIKIKHRLPEVAIGEGNSDRSVLVYQRQISGKRPNKLIGPIQKTRGSPLPAAFTELARVI